MPKWTPAERRTPDKPGRYLLTVTENNRQTDGPLRHVVTGIWTGIGWSHGLVNAKVEAWMPAPPPYHALKWTSDDAPEQYDTPEQLLDAMRA